MASAAEEITLLKALLRDRENELAKLKSTINLKDSKTNVSNKIFVRNSFIH